MSEPINHVTLGLQRITSQYEGQPDFEAYLTALLAPSNNWEAAAQAILASIDIDIASGVQLDLLGEVVGINRNLPNAYPLPFFGYEDTPEGLPYAYDRTNWLRNNTGVGVSPGSPGTLPTFWTMIFTGPGVATRTIVGTGAEDGIEYVDIRYQTTAANIIYLMLEADAQVPALLGEQWTASTYCRVVGGSLAGVTCRVSIVENNAAGGYVSETATLFTPTTAALSTQRPKSSRILNGAATRFVNETLILTATAASDVTLRFGLPQLERGLVSTAPIRTSGAAVTEFAGGGSWYNEFTQRYTTWGLDDPTYRKFIRARILRNLSAGTTEDFIAILQLIFPADDIIVQDVAGQLRVRVGLGRVTTATEEVILGSGLILPKPAGVALVYLPYTEPIIFFGFNPTDATYGDDVIGGGGPFMEEQYA